MIFSWVLIDVIKLIVNVFNIIVMVYVIVLMDIFGWYSGIGYVGC